MKTVKAGKKYKSLLLMKYAEVSCLANDMLFMFAGNELLIRGDVTLYGVKCISVKEGSLP